MPKLVMSAGFLCSGQWRNVTLCRPPPANCNLPPLSGAGSLRSPKFVRRDTILFSSNLSYHKFCELLSGTINSDTEIVKESAYFVVLLEKRKNLL